MIDRNERVITGTVSAAAVTYATGIPHHKSYLVRGTWAGSGIVGFAKLQAGTDNVNWEDLPDSLVSFTAAGSSIWDVTEKNYPYVRIWMESTSGSVTFTADLVLQRESGIG